jgi:hypothetical protein
LTPTQCFDFQVVRPPIQHSYPDHYFVGGRSHRHQQEGVNPENVEWLFVSRPIQDAIIATLLYPLIQALSLIFTLAKMSELELFLRKKINMPGYHHPQKEKEFRWQKLCQLVDCSIGMEINTNLLRLVIKVESFLVRYCSDSVIALKLNQS